MGEGLAIVIAIYLWTMLGSLVLLCIGLAAQFLCRDA